jgi:Arylsulfotransferase (ASST)
MSDVHERPWTRRRFLTAAGGLVVAGTTIGAVYEALRSTSGTAAAGPSPSPVVLGLNTGTASPVASAVVPGVSYRSRPDLAPPHVDIDIPAGSVAPGLVFLTPNNGAGEGGPTIVDNDGELVWMLPVRDRSVTDFRVATYRGQPVLAWWEGSVNGGIGSGDCVIADTSYRQIARISAGDRRTVDLHEFQITPDGTALFFADAGVRPLRAASATPTPAGTPPASPSVLDCAIQEVDVATGKLLWEWHAIDHIAVDETYVKPPSTDKDLFDYVHTNSISVEPDGSLLVSARNTSAVYKIDRSTGAIVWRLGGRLSDFRFGPGATFGWQHDVRRQADGTITMFDDESPPVPARALVLRVDEHARTVQLVRSFTRPRPNLVSSQGNVQALANGNVFVGWGSTPFCSEFDSSGRVVFDATFPSAVQSYRDFRFEWVGDPTDRPSMALEPAASGLTVYASWNGATQLASWEVLTGPDPAHLASVASAARAGFETVIHVATAQSVVAVRALDESGRTLGTSAAMSPAQAG